MYMQLALLYVALIWVFRRVSQSERPGLRTWTALALLEAAALYTHYFAALLIAWLFLATAFTILARKDNELVGKAGRARRLLELGAVQLVVLAAYLPWLGVASRQLTSHTPRGFTPPTLTVYAQETWRFFNSGVLGLAADSSLFARSTLASAVLLLALCFLALGLGLLRRHADWYAMLLHGLLPPAVVFAIGQVRPGVHPRYVLMAAAPLAIAMSVVFAASTSRRRQGAIGTGLAIAAGALAIAAGVALAASWTVALTHYFGDPEYQRADVRSAARLVATSAEPGDIVVLDYEDFAFPYYFGGDAKVEMVDLTDRAEQQVAMMVANVAAGSHVHVVRWDGGRTDFRNTLPALLESAGDLDQRTEVGPFTIDSYRVEDPTAPSAVAADLDADAAELAPGEAGLESDALAPTRDVTSLPTEGSALPSVGTEFGPLWLTAVDAPNSVKSGDALVVSTRWMLPEATQHRLKAVVEVTDARGFAVSQQDQAISDWSGLTTESWPAGSETLLHHVVPIPYGTPPGRYCLNIGVYDEADMRRFDAALTTAAGGQRDAARAADEAPAGSPSADTRSTSLSPGLCGSDPTMHHVATIEVTRGLPSPSDPYGSRSALGLEVLSQPQTAIAPGIKLLAASVAPSAVKPEGSLEVILLWGADGGGESEGDRGREPSPAGDRGRPRTSAPPAVALVQEVQGLEKAQSARTLAVAEGPSVFDFYPTRLWQPGEEVLDRRRIVVPARAEAGPALVVVRGQDEGRHQTAVGGMAADKAATGKRDAIVGEVLIEAPRRVFEEPQVQFPAAVTFPGVGTLVGYDLTAADGCHLDTVDAATLRLLVDDATACRIVLTLYWQASDSVESNLTVFTHLLDAQQRMLAQHDGLPGQGTRPTTGWIGGEYVTDVHELTPAPDAALTDPGRPTSAVLEVGLYDPLTMERVATAGGTDHARLDVEVIIEQR